MGRRALQVLQERRLETHRGGPWMPAGQAPPLWREQSSAGSQRPTRDSISQHPLCPCGDVIDAWPMHPISTLFP